MLAGPDVLPVLEPPLRTSRSRLVRFAAPLLCAVLAACSTAPTGAPAGRVSVTLPATALPGPGYAFVPLAPMTSAEQDARVQDEAFRARLQQALETSLQAQGYMPMEMAKADFLVAWRVGVRDVHEVLPVAETAAGGTRMAAVECSGGRCSQLVVRSDTGAPVSRDRYTTVDRTEGGLLVEMVEPASLRVVWSALNTGNVRPGDATQARLDAIAAQTLEQLPPHHRH